MVPERYGGHDGTGIAGSRKGADESTGPLARLDVAPEAAALGRPADQRRLREGERGLREGERGAGQDDPPAGGGAG